MLNEPKAMWTEIRADEDIMGTYQAQAGRLRLSAADATPEVVERARRMFGWYLSITRSERVVDKYPELVYRAPFVQAIFPDVHFVLLLRRPWDVVTSIVSWSADKGTAQSDWWGVADRKWQVLWADGVLGDDRWRWLADHVEASTGDQAVRGTVEWLLGTSQALDLADDPAYRAHLVRYGDLLTRPVETVDRVLELTGLPGDDAVRRLAADVVARTRPPADPPPSVPDALVAAADELAARAGLLD